MRAILAYAFLMVWTTVSGAIAGGVGKIEIRVTDHKPAIEQFEKLEVRLENLTFHKKGEPRAKAWTVVDVRSMAIDIVPLKDGVFVSLGEYSLPVGGYDAVRIRFADAEGKLKTGEHSEVLFDNTVVSFPVAIEETANAPLVVDLYAEDQTEHARSVYVVKVKEIRTGM